MNKDLEIGDKVCLSEIFEYTTEPYIYKHQLNFLKIDKHNYNGIKIFKKDNLILKHKFFSKTKNSTYYFFEIDSDSNIYVILRETDFNKYIGKFYLDLKHRRINNINKLLYGIADK